MTETLTTTDFKEVFKQDRIDKMEGWCTPEKAQRLYELVVETDSKLSIELGVFGGRSLVALAIGHREKGSGAAIGIDPWNNKACLEGSNDQANNDWWMSLNMKEIYESCQHHIEINNLIGFCETLRLKSVDVAYLFADGVVDVLHQDSNHNPETIIAELKAWIPKLKVGGYWICDDTDWEESRGGYDHLNEFGLVMVEDHVKWQIWKRIK